MGTKHTPGPWRAEWLQATAPAAVGMGLWVISGANGGPVATSHTTGHAADEGSRLDMALIARAPDMDSTLTALRDAARDEVEVSHIGEDLRIAKHKIEQTQQGQYPEGQALAAALFCVEQAIAEANRVMAFVRRVQEEASDALGQ